MNQKLILIGTSTGGPGHLKKLLHDIILPQNTSIVIAQHMGKSYLPSFVSQFNEEINSQVVLLQKKEILKNKVYICEKNSVILPSKIITADICDQVTIFNPNVNILFSSATQICKYAQVLAILLTGIGDDGATAINELYKSGAQCIAESEETAIAFGMPKRAKELNPKLQSAPLNEIKIKLERFINE
ncbi:MCP protein-glutamate methylesterase [Campylobacter iguaniorum]|uniref:protein-glutamate methylesterase n=1 Tax=Campylobacter iguaniorum TaxID=1244531 RepID=A0A076FAC3_9BACT|nr:CheB methylesterase domain-containing protein [Campylobacter iguaniorum]AII14906.1 MCP protein-glutamate methylesterase [Campylobacter iguaniorum]ALV24734.1 MCP protein-glutamate methylesterase [Campylobacter iguaniorum]